MIKVYIILTSILIASCVSLTEEEKVNYIVDLDLESRFSENEFGKFRSDIYYFETKDEGLMLYKRNIFGGINLLSIGSNFDILPKTNESLMEKYSNDVSFLINCYCKYHVKAIINESDCFVIKTDIKNKDNKELSYSLLYTKDIKKINHQEFGQGLALWNDEIYYFYSRSFPNLE